MSSIGVEAMMIDDAGRRAVSLIATFILLATATCAQGTSGNDEQGPFPAARDRASNATRPVWPMAGGNPQHDGLSPFNAKDNPGKERWRFSTENSMIGPVIGPDGTLYAASWDGFVHALDREGTVLWSTNISGHINSCSALGPDGTLHVISGRNLTALFPNGTVKWVFRGNGSLSGDPTVGPDGTVYFGSWTNYTFAVNPDGTLRWTFRVSEFAICSPTIGLDGTVYVISRDNYTYALDPDGNLKWSYDTGTMITESPVLGPGGTVHVVAWSSILALDPSGVLLWKYQGDGHVESRPAFGPDGTMYFGENGSLKAVSANGTVLWKYRLPDEPWLMEWEGVYTYATSNDWIEQIAVSSDGTVFAGSQKSGFFALFPNGTIKWRIDTGDYGTSGIAIAADGTVYCSAGWLFSLGKSVPSAPQCLQIADWDNGAGLIWEAPEDDGGDPVTAYNIYRGADVTSASLLTSVTGSTLSFDDPSAAGKQRVYFVTATNTIGESSQSNLASFPPDVPSPPRNLRAFPGDGMVHLEWDVPESDGGSALLGYRVYQAIENGSATPGPFLDDTSTSAEMPARNGVTIRFRVTASNSRGESAPSNSITAVPRAGASHAPWAMEGHDARHTGNSQYSTAANTGKLKWSFMTEGGIDVNPVIGYDGTIIFGSQTPLLNALDLDGNVRWIDVLKVHSSICNVNTAGIGVDGTVYYSTYDGVLLKYDPTGIATVLIDGRCEDERGLPLGRMSAPTIGSDGTIYLMMSGRQNISGCWTPTDGLLAVSPDGKVLWKYSLPEGTDQVETPALDSCGNIYFIAGSNITHAIGPGGAFKWKYPMQGWRGGSPSIGPDGTVYSAAYNGYLHSFSPDGKLNWRFLTDTTTAAAIGPDGTIYVGGTNGSLFALRPDGSLRWQFTTSQSMAGAPVVDADGAVCVNCRDGNVYLLNPNGTLRWKYQTGARYGGTPAIGPDGTIYVGVSGAQVSVGGGGNRLIAIGSESSSMLSPPRNLQANASPEGMNLIWESPAFISDHHLVRYQIYRNSSLLASVDINQTTYTDTTVVDGSHYAYHVTARNSTLESGESNRVTVRMPTTPSAPSGLKGKYRKGSVTLDWQEPTDDGGLPIEGYNVYRGKSPQDITFIGTVNATSLSYMDAVKVRGDYFYCVTAFNGFGEGAPTIPRKVNARDATSGLTVPGSGGVGIVVASAILLAIIGRGRRH